MTYRTLSAALFVLLLGAPPTQGAPDPTILAGAGDPFRVITLKAPDNSIVANFLSYGATTRTFGSKTSTESIETSYLAMTIRKRLESDPSHPYFGGIVGRYANRIKNGCDRRQRVSHPENENGGLDTLHGGLTGYDRRNWAPIEVSKSKVTYHLIDPDGTQGFPGTVQALVTYTLLKGAKWKIEMYANATAKTPILLSSHVYWNLEARVIAADGILIPTGELTNVTGTYWNFRNETRIGDVIDKAVGYCGTGCTGLDNAWIYDRSAESKSAFSLSSPNSGIKMSVTTDQPALQVYTCNGIANNGAGKNVTIPRKKAHGGPKKYYPKHSCAVIEQEGWIGGINNPEFGQDQIYGPDRDYKWSAVYSFSS
ncbi:hypothetical protein RhiLY_01073 [Ceratobasidium sp. AG-Ba]|nr:hypothetical protein RhiLY_01073 [Ceratobasidium sp. AG-Ba]